MAILDYYKENGLWETKEIKNDKGKVLFHTLSKNRLNQEQYDEAKKTINGLNANGFTPKEQEQKEIKDKQRAKMNETLMNAM